MIEARFVEAVAQRVNASPAHVGEAVALLDGGATIPFIAHYRKDATGNLSERQLERIGELNTYFTSLTDRRNALMHTLEQEGRLDEATRAKFLGCMDKHILEDLYLPFKKKGHVKAAHAREQGLEPLAEFMWDQTASETTIEETAASYMNGDLGVPTVEAALEGARHILGERLAHDPDVRGMVRDALLGGQLITQATKNAEDKKTKFEAFYNFAEPLSKVRSHRLLTIFRGVRKGFLRMELLIDDDAVKELVVRHIVKDGGAAYEPFLRSVVDEAYKRHLRPALENDVVAMAREEAEIEAVALLRESVEGILMAPPAGAVAAIGIQPTAESCAVAAIDAQGQLLETTLMYPLAPRNETDASLQLLRELATKHGICVFAIANSPGSRDVARIVDQAVEGLGEGSYSIFVNDTAARVYAESRVGSEELPELDVASRSAVSVARRFQDPLRELVKVEPRSLGVGQYQYDINPKALREAFTQSVISCVNRVRVDVNTDSIHMLRYVSGVQFNTAQNLVQRRQESGPFTNRNQFIEVNGIGPKVFEMAAGFLRVCGGDQPLDATEIHPEAYGVVEKLANVVGKAPAELLQDGSALQGMDLSPYAEGTVGPLALEDIRTSVVRPGADPRPAFRVPTHKQLHSIDDLNVGMDVEGVVTNVTDFGAFVDLGVYHDGLIHLSELANHFVRDPREILSAGEVVKVRVIGVDAEQKRISLSRKALIATPNRAVRHHDRGKPGDSHGTQERASSGPPARGADSRPPRSKQGRKASQRRRPQQDSPKKPHSHEQKEGSLNTLLADQLLAMRDKFKS